uniref:Uncharacterized protein n=1 Tax=Setaria digitata TaxID=48799 RepID=A0A915PYI2_9BILA
MITNYVINEQNTRTHVNCEPLRRSRRSYVDESIRTHSNMQKSSESTGIHLSPESETESRCSGSGDSRSGMKLTTTMTTTTNDDDDDDGK